MPHTQQQWKQLQAQVIKLRKQNEQLKKLLQIQLTKIKPPELSIPKRQFQSWKQEDNHIPESSDQYISVQSNKKTVKELKTQWAQWSCMLEASIMSKNHKSRPSAQLDELRKTSFMPGSSVGSEYFHGRKSIESVKSRNSEQVINLDLKSPVKSETGEISNDSNNCIDSDIKINMNIAEQKQVQLELIEDIFLFGPNIKDIQNAAERKFMAGHQLFFPQNKRDEFQIYGTYLFPNELEVKHIRQKNYAVEVNKMIFKNNKKLDCNVFIFQSQQNQRGLKKKNPILDKVNPSNWLYALSIQFSDFLMVNNSEIPTSKANQTHSMINDGSGERYVQGDMAIKQSQNMEADNKKPINQLAQQKFLFKSNFCLCIMTYFPFIRFLKDILIQVFNSVKLRRMNAYQSQNCYKQIDIFFFIQQLNNQLSKFLKNQLKISPQINKIYELKLNQVNIKLDLKQNNLINEVVSDWAFKIMKILDKETLLDIFCYTMMEESICFVSDDNNVLTFVILLYVMVMTLPFGYPHPCVSVVFNDQLLEAPFTAVLGINKGTKWLEENLQSLTQNQEHKIIVNLNEEQVKLKWKKRPRTHKSQRLKKIFTNFYKKIQTSALPSLFKKKIQLISRETTREQNQHVSQFLNDLFQYYQDQLLSHLPNCEIIQLIKQSCRQSNNNENELYEIVSEKIEKYMLESRKAKDNKDHFIDALVGKQPFRIYLDKVYQLR